MPVRNLALTAFLSLALWGCPNKSANLQQDTTNAANSPSTGTDLTNPAVFADNKINNTSNAANNITGNGAIPNTGGITPVANVAPAQAAATFGSNVASFPNSALITDTGCTIVLPVNDIGYTPNNPNQKNIAINISSNSFNADAVSAILVSSKNNTYPVVKMAVKLTDGASVANFVDVKISLAGNNSCCPVISVGELDCPKNNKSFCKPLNAAIHSPLAKACLTAHASYMIQKTSVIDPSQKNINGCFNGAPSSDSDSGSLPSVEAKAAVPASSNK